MEVIRSFSGEGWLRVSGFAATTARYDINVMRRKTSIPVGGLYATGFIATEMPSMMGVPLTSVLVTLEDGNAHRGKITAISAQGVEVLFDAPLALLSTA
ncbi:hypothetical protein KHC28_14310 [Ancylobacter sonchi]|uniref:hypothetical protein n=1 Tax=Ancylobacter TaxID=99 RepID=UPI001BD6C269|nr:MULTISPECIES: hypothetical protein [Ancylobacter]MBS7534832.1 hypothetical protein [Ancylobacter sonchi]MCB4770484.1 hypothetical protein [Ancylobacter sp. Lp-2]